MYNVNRKDSFKLIFKVAKKFYEQFLINVTFIGNQTILFEDKDDKFIKALKR